MTDQPLTQLTATDKELQQLKLTSLREEQMLVVHSILNPKLSKRIALQVDPELMWEQDHYRDAVKAIIHCVNQVDGLPSRTDLIESVEPIFRKTDDMTVEFANRYREAETDHKSGSYYLKRVIDRMGRRRIFSELDPKMILADTWTTADALGQAREAMLDISRTASTATGRGGLLARDYHENVDTLHERLEGNVEIGFDTGLKQLDDVIGQFKASSYNIIGARPSIGKTAVTVNMVLALAKLGIRTMFITLEVPYDDILSLMCCCHNGLRKSQIKANPSQNVRSRLSETYEELHRLPIELHADCNDISKIVTICEDAITREHQPVQAIFIDYMQIIRTRKRMRTDLDRLNLISDAFRQLKSDHTVALFIAAQLNRKSADGIPKLEDLKGSGDFEQDADTVMLLHRPNKDLAEREDADPKMEKTVHDDQLDIYVRKNRHGRTGRVSFRWDGATGVISEMSEDDRRAADRSRVSNDSRQEEPRRYSDGSMDVDDDLPF